MQIPKSDFYQSVTDGIVLAIEQGTPPWVRPWALLGDCRPRNATTGRPYSGINTWLLSWEQDAKGYVSPRWMTFRQAINQGGGVRRGERGTQVVFYRLAELPARRPGPTEDTSSKVVPILRTFTVFNVQQIDGLSQAITAPADKTPSWESLSTAEGMLTDSAADIRHGGDKAYYHPALDFIQLPVRPAFSDNSAYYATALHELTHWTAHANRCARTLGKRFGDAAYAMEELIAEMGSAYLYAHCRINGHIQHPSYLAHWLRVLKTDKRAIFAAAAKAQQAADFLIGRVDFPERVGELKSKAA